MGIFRFINKDVVSENENKRGMVSLRILYLVVFCAFTADVFLAGAGMFTHYATRTLCFFAALILLFFQTYYARTRTSIVGFIFFLLCWIMLMIRPFGWSAGMQNYFIVILMICFFVVHGSPIFKFTLAGIVLVARCVTIFAFSGTLPDYGISELRGKMIQVSNISAVFISIIVIAFIFSREENEAESKLMKYNERLARQANTDALTGLFNRRSTMEFLDEVARSVDHYALSVAIGDIDFFKRVNDTYGHDAGDEVLKFVSNAMQIICGESVFLSRWGGEEFLLVMPDLNGDQAFALLDRLRTEIKASVIRCKDQEIRITMTFGLTEFDYNSSIEDMIKEADEKLYHGKESGRNKVVY